MADIILNKPEAGTQAVFEAAGDSRIDLNFPTDQATLERSGNDLIFRFDDGSTVVLRDFYTAYTKDSMPDFVIEGTPIAGEQFFTALNDGLTSAIIAFLRTLVFQVGAVLTFPLLWKLDGIWLSIVAAEVMAVITTAIFLVVGRKRYGY